MPRTPLAGLAHVDQHRTLVDHGKGTVHADRPGERVGIAVEQAGDDARHVGVLP